MSQQNEQSAPQHMPTPVVEGDEGTDQSTSSAEEPREDSAIPETDNPSAANSSQPAKSKSKWYSVKRAYAKSERAYDRLVADKWPYEILGILICISTLLAIMAVLFAYQNSPSPRIMAGVSLNTVISILATFSRAAAALVAASAISQQKWLRMTRNDRTLIETLWYDEATRGPRGSLYLLWTLHVNFITALAAVVMVLALGFEPFVQQSVRYPLRNQLVLSDPPPLISTIQNPTQKKYLHENTTIDAGSVVAQALYADSVDPLVSKSTCRLPTCDWPPYGSAAVCSLCEEALEDVNIEPKRDDVLETHDMSYYLNTCQSTDLDLGDINSGGPVMSIFRNTTYNISLGQGVPYTFQMNASATFQTGFQAYNELMFSYPASIVWDLYGGGDSSGPCSRGYFDWSAATVINGVTAPLKAFGYLTLIHSDSLRRLVATSAKRCVISLCAQQYSSSYENGSLVTNVTARDWGTTEVNSGCGKHGVPGFFWNATINSTQFRCGDGPDDETGFVYGETEIPGFIRYPLRQLEGFTTNYTDEINNIRTENAPNDVMKFMSDIEGNCGKIAQGLTNYIQQHGDGHAEGNAYTPTPFVEVRWAWLTYPIILVVLACIISITTMVQTRRGNLPPWRTSPFPLLFNYHDRDACVKETVSAPQPASGPQPQSQAQPAPEGVLPPAPTRRPPPPPPIPAETVSAASTTDADALPTPAPAPAIVERLGYEQIVPAAKTSEHEQLAARTRIQLRPTADGTSWVFEKVETKFETDGQIVAA